MKTPNLLFTFMLLLCCTTSCKSDEIAVANIQLEKTTISKEAQEITLKIYYNKKWIIKLDNQAQNWCSLSQSTGTGDAVVTIKVATNTFDQERKATIDVSTPDGKQTLILTQAGNKQTPTNGNYIEIPTLSNEREKDDIYVTHYIPNSAMRNYTICYDTIQKISHWVAYPLSRDYLGSANRTDQWGYDPQIPIYQQPYMRKGIVGDGPFDRGHQLPSGDRTISTNANIQTFYYTNITSQIRTLNQGKWAQLEGKVRIWSSECDTLYVVTGAMATTDTDKNIRWNKDNKGENIAVPKYYFKALAKRTGDHYTTVAICYDNVSTASEERMTVAALEAKTGFTFFPQLPNPEVKKIIDNNQWK